MNYNREPTLKAGMSSVQWLTVIDVFRAGAEEGMRYMEKTANKHNEIVESIKELSSGLVDLEAKLQVSCCVETLQTLWDELVVMFSYLHGFGLFTSDMSAEDLNLTSYVIN